MRAYCRRDRDDPAGALNVFWFTPEQVVVRRAAWKLTQIFLPENKIIGRMIKQGAKEIP